MLTLQEDGAWTLEVQRKKDHFLTQNIKGSEVKMELQLMGQLQKRDLRDQIRDLRDQIPVVSGKPTKMVK